mmetsp:Transcript_16504/g.36571  ORF Transcript_16504/g.36571 Transcript_16504/m.36571 type:complete len:223 (-) Transcript_16504:667-1335(-)
MQQPIIFPANSHSFAVSHSQYPHLLELCVVQRVGALAPDGVYSVAQPKVPQYTGPGFSGWDDEVKRHEHPIPMHSPNPFFGHGPSPSPLSGPFSGLVSGVMCCLTSHPHPISRPTPGPALMPMQLRVHHQRLNNLLTQLFPQRLQGYLHFVQGLSLLLARMQAQFLEFIAQPQPPHLPAPGFLARNPEIGGYNQVSMDLPVGLERPHDTGEFDVVDGAEILQ